MTEYTDPTTVKPGSAGTATVTPGRSPKALGGVRVLKAHGNGDHFWISTNPHLWGAGVTWIHDTQISDLVLDPLPGEAPADSVVITLDDLEDWLADPELVRKYASDLRREGRAAAADLLDIIADKLAALPKPVPPKPEEPKEFAAQVEAKYLDDGKALVWTRIRDSFPWRSSAGHRCFWAELTDVTVLRVGIGSEGVL